MNTRLNRFKPLALLLPLTFSVQLFAQNKLPEIKVDAAPLVRTPQNSYAPIVEKVSPCVVTISINEMRRVGGRAARSPVLDDPLFGDLDLDKRKGGDPDDGTPRKRVEIGMGSGVVVSADGYILTNNHVVESGDEIIVTMADGKTKYTAKKIGRDSASDIAVIKVEAKDLPVATFANSDQVKVGDMVLAIGNPFALRQTVTSGIISATGRKLSGSGQMRAPAIAQIDAAQFSNLLQTDAAINPGNSGGALVDIEGRLIGINSAIFSRTGGNIGIGFAVPGNQARTVMESLIKHGRMLRGDLGANYQDLTDKLAKEFKLASTNGVLVAEITKDSAAEKSGLKTGDVILELNGKTVESMDAFIRVISDFAPGTEVKLKISRKGETQEVAATLGERSVEQDKVAESRTPKSSATAPDHEPDVLDGISVSDIRAEHRAQFGLPESVRGALIRKVDPGSACAEAEIKAGDVIVEIDDKPVKDADAAVKISEEVKKKSSVRLRVNTRGTTRFVIVEEIKK